MRYIGLITVLLTNISFALPAHFVYLNEIDPSIIQDIRYYSSNNFVGKPISGYEKPTCILTENAAQQLSNIQHQLRPLHLSLLVYDCYRPTRAVDEFVAWSQDVTQQIMKPSYYPRVDKAQVFKLGYVMKYSGHSRGSTVDLTIAEFKNGHIKPLEMGTHFDFLDVMSHPFANGISEKAKQNRFMLRKIMWENGFKPIATEWWHFTLQDEPYPHTYFDFLVK